MTSTCESMPPAHTGDNPQYEPIKQLHLDHAAIEAAFPLAMEGRP